MRIPTSAAVCAVICAAVGLTTFAQTRDRASVPIRFTWNLADLYASDAAWRTEKDAVAKQIPSLATFKGKLGSSPAALAAP